MISKQKRGVDLHTQLQQLSKQQLIDVLRELQQRKKISAADIEQFTTHQGILIPCSLFCEALSPFESICTYLKEHEGLSYHEIAQLVKRDDRTIWTVYQHAQKKQQQKFITKKDEIHIPLNILQDRRLSVLEHLVRYLKDSYGMTYHEIAVLLKRDDRTIWTVYQRGLKKVKP